MYFILHCFDVVCGTYVHHFFHHKSNIQRKCQKDYKQHGHIICTMSVCLVYSSIFPMCLHSLHSICRRSLDGGIFWKDELVDMMQASKERVYYMTPHSLCTQSESLCLVNIDLSGNLCEQSLFCWAPPAADKDYQDHQSTGSHACRSDNNHRAGLAPSWLPLMYRMCGESFLMGLHTCTMYSDGTFPLLKLLL